MKEILKEALLPLKSKSYWLSILVTYVLKTILIAFSRTDTGNFLNIWYLKLNFLNGAFILACRFILFILVVKLLKKTGIK